MEKYLQKTNDGKMKERGPAALKGVHQWYQRMNPKPSVSKAAGENAEGGTAPGLRATHEAISTLVMELRAQNQRFALVW